MMLHLRPDLVRPSLIRDDPDDTPRSLRGLFWARDFGRRTDHGVVGHPERADAARGRRMLDAIARRVVEVATAVIDLPLPANPGKA